MSDTCLCHHAAPICICHLRAIPCAIHPAFIYISQSRSITREVVLILFIIWLITHRIARRIRVIIGPTTPSNIVTCTHSRRLINQAFKSYRTWIVQSQRTCFTTFGCNQNYTVSTTRTIDGCRRSIFQDVDWFNITRVDRLNATRVQRHTIYYIKWWIGSIQRTVTTNTNITQFTRTLTGRNIHAGSLTLQSLKSIRYRLCIQFFRRDTSQSTRHIRLLLNTVTYDNHLIQLRSLRADYHIHLCPFPTHQFHGFLYRLISDSRYY